MSGNVVYVVHCVDTEGPLYESLEVTFARLKDVFGIEMEANEENLRMLSAGEIEFAGDVEQVRKFLDGQLICNHGDWAAVEGMLEKITSTEFRNSVPDSFGNGWIYNWFCLDHVCYETNPRKRDLGDHKIFDYYKKLLKQHDCANDRIHFHYHPLPYNKAAHSCATFYFNQNHIYRILAKKIIDRCWFPSVFRPGFHTIRPDSNWFLEQWIPFDYSNQASDAKVTQPDLANGRWGDWRRAPKIWAAYHPSHDDYQVSGTSRRWIFRCLNIRARLSQLEQRDVDAAFRQAQKNGAALLAFTDHDFRDMGADVIRASKMIVNASEKCPDVKFKYSNAVDGARQYLKLEQLSEIGFKIHLTSLTENSLLMRITSKNDLFGPQPFLAVKTRYCSEELVLHFRLADFPAKYNRKNRHSLCSLKWFGRSADS
ncbi:MAG: hypothetical protein ACYSUB_10545 [Planctomycetota bacterium]|jgi:hypothetical protein